MKKLKKNKKPNPPLKSIWKNMRVRCNNPNNVAYKHYGGRGIKLEWPSRKAFAADMYPTYQKGLTLERIDVNGNYSKENCKWIPKEQQSLNRRDSVLIEYRGVKKHIQIWAKEKNIRHKTLYSRIYMYGWTIERAMETPQTRSWSTKGKSGHKGIIWIQKYKKWIVKVKGKQIGMFRELKDAIKAKERITHLLEQE